MLDVFLILIMCLCLIYIIDKRKYKVRHSIYAGVCFIGAFSYCIGTPVFSHNINNLIVIFLFLTGVWHLTKACFFIDTNEIKKEKE